MDGGGVISETRGEAPPRGRGTDGRKMRRGWTSEGKTQRNGPPVFNPADSSPIPFLYLIPYMEMMSPILTSQTLSSVDVTISPNVPEIFLPCPTNSSTLCPPTPRTAGGGERTVAPGPMRSLV